MSLSDVENEYPDAEELDEGGQRSAYKISHPEYGDAVLKKGEYSRGTTLERIRREVETLREINSDHYPDNYEFRVNEDAGEYEVIEEWIESVPLAQAWTRFTSPIDALLLINNIANGLSVLWGQKIVHRDVKPDNILIRDNGTPVIIDLGIARQLDMDSLTMTLARRGPCTPIYAAPEQLRNQKGEIDWRTDQFNLGILLVQLLLEGDHPFNPDVVGRSDNIVENILNNRWYSQPLNTEKFRSLLPLANKMLGAEPYERFREPDHLFESLQGCIDEFA